MKKRWHFLGVLFLVLMFTSCVSIEKEEESKEIFYEVMDEDEIPEKMKAMIEEKKEKGFRIAYEEEGWLYVGLGYGRQEIEGYQIEVDQCRMSEHFLYAHTVFTGPPREPAERNPSWPYIVFRAEAAGKQVVFLN